MKNKMTVVFLLSIMIFQWGCQRAGQDVIWDGTRSTSAYDRPEEEEDSDSDTAEDTEMQQALICVDVCGAVENPGVYYLNPGARVYEAVQMAGGLALDADRDTVNQAEMLKDGAKIRIYSIEEAEKLQDSQAEPGLVNLNTADVAALCTLSGIGEARAKDIIAYREAHGDFQTVEEIMNVSGIKEATFYKIKDKIVAE